MCVPIWIESPCPQYCRLERMGRNMSSCALRLGSLSICRFKSCIVKTHGSIRLGALTCHTQHRTRGHYIWHALSMKCTWLGTLTTLKCTDAWSNSTALLEYCIGMWATMVWEICVWVCRITSADLSLGQKVLVLPHHLLLWASPKPALTLSIQHWARNISACSICCSSEHGWTSFGGQLGHVVTPFDSDSTLNQQHWPVLHTALMDGSVQLCVTCILFGAKCFCVYACFWSCNVC